MLKELEEILEYFTFNFITPAGNYNLTLCPSLFNSICEDYYLEYDIFDVTNYKFESFKEFLEYQRDIAEFKQKYDNKKIDIDEVADILDLLFGENEIIQFNIFDSLYQKNINIIFKPTRINDNLRRLIYNQ